MIWRLICKNYIFFIPDVSFDGHYVSGPADILVKCSKRHLLLTYLHNSFLLFFRHITFFTWQIQGLQVAIKKNYPQVGRVIILHENDYVITRLWIYPSTFTPDLLQFTDRLLSQTLITFNCGNLIAHINKILYSYIAFLLKYTARL